MRQAGYSEATSKNPCNLTRSKAWRELVDDLLPEQELATKHKALLNSSKVQWYEFPVPEKPKRRKKLVPQARGGSIYNDSEAEEDEGEFMAGGPGTPNLSDAEIKAIVESVPGCKLIYIKDTSWARTAYYQAPDNRSQKDALDMAYKIRGSYSPEKVEMKGRFSELTNEELANLIARTKKQLMKR